jgi:hypothetical protein
VSAVNVTGDVTSDVTDIDRVFRAERGRAVAVRRTLVRA